MSDPEPDPDKSFLDPHTATQPLRPQLPSQKCLKMTRIITWEGSGSRERSEGRFSQERPKERRWEGWG